MAGSTPASAIAEPDPSGGPGPAGKAEPLGKSRASVSLWAEAWRRFKRHRMAYWSLWVLGLLVLAVLLGPLVYKVGINDIDFKARLAPPSWQHPLGTDDLGRDLLARVLYGRWSSIYLCPEETNSYSQSRREGCNNYKRTTNHSFWS